MVDALTSKLKFYIAMMRLINILMLALVSSKEVTKYSELQKYLRGIEYDPMDRPNINGSALNVSVQFGIYSIRNIDKKSFTYSLSISTILSWLDERLTALKVLHPGIDVPQSTLWRPVFGFYNSITQKEYDNYLVTTGREVVSFVKKELLLTCPMNLLLFPFDKQQCKVVFSSSQFGENIIDPLMAEKEYTIEEQGGLAQQPEDSLTLTEYTIKNITVIKRPWSKSYTEWPVLELTFHLQRVISPYITQYFLPTLILTKLSWASFWVPPTIYPARIALVLTNFLALCVIQRGVKYELPMTSYMTALEIYVVVNMAFIVIVMLEYILVLVLEDNQKRKNLGTKTKPRNSMQEREIGLDNMSDATGQISTECDNVDNELHHEIPSAPVKEGLSAAHSIDKMSRIILPVSCLIFNIAFFTHYL